MRIRRLQGDISPTYNFNANGGKGDHFMVRFCLVFNQVACRRWINSMSKKLRPENLHHGDHEVDDKEISDVLLSSSLPFSHFNTL